MGRTVLVPLALLLAIAASACIPIQAPTASQPSALETRTAPEPEQLEIFRAADVPRISVEEAMSYFESGAAIFVDSRSKDSYDVEHIAGAFPRPDGAQPELDTSIPKDQLIITYCT